MWPNFEREEYYILLVLFLIESYKKYIGTAVFLIAGDSLKASLVAEPLIERGEYWDGLDQLSLST